MNNKLIVNEIFTSIQGEGPSTGKLATFIRLLGCNLKCTFCDSVYTWKFSNHHHDFDNKIYDAKEERTDYTIEETISLLEKNNPRLLVITGGEPLLQDKALYNLFINLNKWYEGKIEIETAGTLSPRYVDCFENVFFNVSPKLMNSGNSLSDRYYPTHLKRFLHNDRSIFKFVISSLEDFEEIRLMQEAIQIPDNLIWIMPMTNPNKEILLSDLAEKAIENRWNVSGRLHTLFWGMKRGV